MEQLECGFPCLMGLRRYVVASGVDLNSWELLQFRDNVGNLIYTVLAYRYRYRTTPVDFRELQNFCYRNGLAYPMEMRSYGDAGICLLYGPLKTLRQLLYEWNFSVPPAILKSIIHQILSLRKTTCLLWIINQHTVVCDGLKCSLLFPFYQANPQNNDSPVDDIRALYDTIVSLFREQPALIIPDDLKCLLRCMSSATTPARCRRLERSPYFLSPYEKIWDFIPRVFQAMHCSDDFATLVKGKTIKRCWVRLCRLQHAEMIAVYREGKYSNSTVYTLFRYLRNFVQHGIEKYKKLEKIWDVVRGLTENQRKTLTDSGLQRLVKAQLGQPKMSYPAYLYHLGMRNGVELASCLKIFVDGYTLNGNSILLHQIDDLVRAINILSPGLFEEVFMMTFNVSDSEIGVLDPPT